MRTLVLAVLLSSTAAFAQTGSDATRGNTPPGKSQDGSGPADGAIKGGSIVPGEKAGIPDNAPAVGKNERLSRCDELTGLLREQCLDPVSFRRRRPKRLRRSRRCECHEVRRRH